MSRLAKDLRAASLSTEEGPDISDVFSTWLYLGTNASQTITNGVDLQTDGGMVFIKNRDANAESAFFDTENGTNRYASTVSQLPFQSAGGSLTQFRTDGFSISTSVIDGLINNANVAYASWSFKKHEKFFDVVEYTGDGNSSQQIAHNLGTVPGAMIIKKTAGAISGNGPWVFYHRQMGPTQVMYINLTDAAQTDSTVFNNTSPTSTHFTVGSTNDVNGTNNTYIAYLFAHNNADGIFGPNADQDIIKCGSFGGSGGTQTVNVGFEPEFVLMKVYSGQDTGSRGMRWIVTDSMRGTAPTLGDTRGRAIWLDSGNSEDEDQYLNLTPTGFQWQNSSEAPSYVYIAIRRGSLFPPETVDEVYHNQALTSTAGGKYVSPTVPLFPVDMALSTIPNLGQTKDLFTRSQQFIYTQPSGAAGPITSLNYTRVLFDSNQEFKSDQFSPSATNPMRFWEWKRAPGFFDIAAYTGNGTSTASRQYINHNLGVVPEMIWVKSVTIGVTANWKVYHKGLFGSTYPDAEDNYLELNTDIRALEDVNFWGSTAPTSTNFRVGGNNNDVNLSNRKYLAYLFATLPGISKVGSFSHTLGATTDVACGFSSGSRFVLVKKFDTQGTDWWLWDSQRGIGAGNDPIILLNTTQAEQTNADYINTLSSGFQMTTTLPSGEYIFYAIAN